MRRTSPYGVTKVAVELLADVYCDLYGFAWTSRRSALPRYTVLGSGCRSTSLIRTCLDGRPYRLPRGADRRFHFVGVEDVAAATAGALNSTRLQQRVYNATGRSQITFARAAELVREAVPQARNRIGPGALDSDQLGRSTSLPQGATSDISPAHP